MWGSVIALCCLAPAVAFLGAHGESASSHGKAQSGRGKVHSAFMAAFPPMSQSSAKSSNAFHGKNRLPIVRPTAMRASVIENKEKVLENNVIENTGAVFEKPAAHLRKTLEHKGPLPVVVSASVAKADSAKYLQELKEADAGGVDWFHMSIQDGVFVPKMGISTSVVDMARKHFPSKVIDVKLGCVDPENRIKEFVSAGADIISFHPEATKQPASVVAAINKAEVVPGLVLNPGTSVSSIESLLGHVGVIVVMLVSPGHGGPKYLDEAVFKIKEIKRLCKERGLNEPYIEVDGGANTKNVDMFTKAGATAIVAGGAVFTSDDKKATIDALRR